MKFVKGCKWVNGWCDSLKKKVLINRKKRLQNCSYFLNYYKIFFELVKFNFYTIYS